MVNSLYPVIYNEKHEVESIKNFNDFISEQITAQLIDSMKDEKEPIGYQTFHQKIRALVRPNEVKDVDIDCIFVILSRDCDMYSIQRKPQEEIIRKIQGFDLEALKKLVFRIKKKLSFNEVTLENSNEHEGHENETPILGGRR